MFGYFTGVHLNVAPVGKQSAKFARVNYYKLTEAVGNADNYTENEIVTLAVVTSCEIREKLENCSRNMLGVGLR